MNNKLLTLGLVGCLTVGVFAYDASAIDEIKTSSTQEACKYYVRGGIAYNMVQKKKGDLDKRFKGFGGEIGFGYNFNENIRSDLSVLYDNVAIKDKDQQSANKNKLSIDRIGVLANVYYQFDTGVLSPYLRAGVGFQSTRGKVSGELLGGFINVRGKMATKRKTHFLYKVGAGISYAVSQNTFIDLEYNLSNLKVSAGDKKVKDSSFKYNRFNHAIMTGIRVVF